jgi:hypothetical protein
MRPFNGRTRFLRALGAVVVATGIIWSPAVMAQETFQPAGVVGAGMTAKQKVEHASNTAATLETGVERILTQIEDAQKNKDILRLNCLNEKLGHLRGLLKVVQDAKLGLREAVARENADLEEHHYRKVAISEEQGGVILAEAEACAGATGSGGVDGTRVVVTVDGDDKSGDDAFGSSPSGTTRTEEASPSQ